MGLKETLDKVKLSIGADNAEANALVADAIREASDVLDSLSSANRESAGRKTKIRELEAELETVKTDLDAAKKNDIQPEIDRLKKIEAEFQEHKKNQAQALRDSWAEKAKRFDVAETDARHGKITKLREQFAWADEGKELEIDAVQANLKAFTIAELAGMFDEVKPADTRTPAPRSTDTKPQQNPFAGAFK